MIDIFRYIFETIQNERKVRILVGVFISILSLLIAVLGAIYGRSLNYFINEYAPVFLGVVTSVAGMSLALSKQRVGGRQRRKAENKDIDDRDLIKTKTTELSDMFYAFRIRMIYDSERLKTNSFKNLAIGIIFSFAALILLMFFVIWQDPYPVSSSYVEFLARWFAPRISIVLLLQFVGFFFLRLYVASELDLKHNKNEITNVEAQIMAYAMSKEYGADLVKIVVGHMSATERNFIIKSGEKTISIENESQYNDFKDIIANIINRLPDRKSA